MVVTIDEWIEKVVLTCCVSWSEGFIIIGVGNHRQPTEGTSHGST
jgi:hypothetical protein